MGFDYADYGADPSILRVVTEKHKVVWESRTANTQAAETECKQILRYLLPYTVVARVSQPLFILDRMLLKLKQKKYIR